MSDDIEERLRAAAQRAMSPDQRERQRINFAVGNAAEDEDSTVESVQAASTIMKSVTSPTKD